MAGISAEPPPLPGRVDVAIVGAGLSGLLAARRIEGGGRGALVLEARDRVGGRLLRKLRDNGSPLEIGGEFTGPGQDRLRALADELGVGVEPLPGLAAAAAGGLSVRLHGGERRLEAVPFAGQGEEAVYAEAVASLDGLAAMLPADAPWQAPAAAELDGITFAAWLADRVGSAAVRAALANAFVPLGASAAELSLLYVLWIVRLAGSFARYGEEVSARFVPGSSALAQRLADGLRSPVALSAPVRAVKRDGEGVVLHSDRGVVRAGAAILALAPSQCSKIEFSPPLPPLRDRAQDRWLQGHGGKVFAVYDHPWWRVGGLTGFASGHDLLPFVLDVSPADGGEGILCGLVCSTSENVAGNGASLADEGLFRAAALDALAACFGPRAARARELHVKLWQGDRWSDGCGTGLPPGVLSAVGPALRPAIGRLVWAGAETGLHEHMEGAVEAGERAAAEALALL